MSDAKKCPNCGHPMMQGPLQVNRFQDDSGEKRTADWWCANCHHAIWAKS